MSYGTLRRRLHHGDVDGGRYERYEASNFDSLNEPLLGNTDNDYNKHSEDQALADILDDERKKERLHWTLLFTNIIAQWAQWLANIILGSGSLLGRIFPFISGNQSGLSSTLPPVLLSPLQEARLKYLRQRLTVPFDGNLSEHQDALRQLWRLSYPDRELPALKSEVWKDMGWQGPDPSTDFRGGGYISLENLIFFATIYPEAFQNLLNKREGERSEWEYPFAVAGINISFMLIQMLDLQSGEVSEYQLEMIERRNYCRKMAKSSPIEEIVENPNISCLKYFAGNPGTVAGHRFLELLSEDEMAFDNLFCVAFKLLDAQWLAKRASYMEFNDVLRSTRSQLERELAIEDVSTVRDLPAYNLLQR